MAGHSSHKTVPAGRAPLGGGSGEKRQRPAASGETAPARRASRLLLFERDESGEAAILTVLKSVGLDAVHCRDGRALVEEAIRRLPDVVIFELTTHDDEDLGILELLRRAAPTVPLILVASRGSLMTQKLMQGLRPMYTIVGPVESAELQEVVEAALTPRARGGGIM